MKWQRGDIFTQPPPAPGGVRIANLFLHHFEAESLTALGRWLDNADLLVFNEPDRAALPHWLGRLMHPWINHVTRHDMHVSITAGFAAGEIQRLLGLDPPSGHSRKPPPGADPDRSAGGNEFSPLLADRQRPPVPTPPHQKNGGTPKEIRQIIIHNQRGDQSSSRPSQPFSESGLLVGRMMSSWPSSMLFGTGAIEGL